MGLQIIVRMIVVSDQKPAERASRQPHVQARPELPHTAPRVSPS
jgi:hypothetical protein